MVEQIHLLFTRLIGILHYLCTEIAHYQGTNMSGSNRLLYLFIAFVVVAIWGSTFVFTKLLLTNGLSPAQIFTLRFIIAYLLLLFLEWYWHRRLHKPLQLFCHSRLDELIMAGLGLTGGSLYFLGENAAMLYTSATNTSLIVCSCPLFTMVAMALVYRDEHFTHRQISGSLMACLGMAIVVLNGHFVLHLSPLGDLLAFSACISWAFYSLLIKQAAQRYTTLFITRKVFFYGIVTIFPYYLFFPVLPPLSTLLRADILANLLFLSCVASLLCFLAWNLVIKKLGPVETTNWVYFNPITTIIFAQWLLNEPITPYFLVGTVLILGGMYMARGER